MFQPCFNLARIRDDVGNALRVANQGHVTANSHSHNMHSSTCTVLHAQFYTWNSLLVTNELTKWVTIYFCIKLYFRSKQGLTEFNQALVVEITRLYILTGYINRHG